MLPFRLSCLGPPDLRGPDGEPIRFRTRKHFALLIYLAVHPSLPHRRDRLATLLWPGAELDEARHSLATALSMLRGKLGHDLFEAGRDTVRLEAGRVLTDLPALEHDAAAELEVPTYRPFLEDFEIPDAPDFQQWKDGQQARLLPWLHTGLTRRIEEARRRGDSRALEILGERLCRIDPLSEDAVRAVVEARAMAGDRIGALRLFDRWRIQLADDLGAHPGPLLQRMADRLRRGRWEGGAPTAPVAPVPTEQWKEQRFVGRGDEFSTCYGIWEIARRGVPRHLLVRGESGVGKTTLVERFTTTLALEGASVARVQCYQLERELPFGVIGGLVNRLLDLPGASATPPEQLAELGRLVARVRQRYPSLPPPLPTEGESARIMFTEGVMALVAALAEEHPVVLVVDDIHLADATSLAVLHLMLRRIDDLPLLVVLTSSIARDAETPEARRFAENAASIGLTELALGPLPEPDAATLLDESLREGEEPGAALRRSILAGAAGNPLVLELLLDDWRRRGDACLAVSLGAMTGSAERPPRDAFRQLVEGTLAALDPEARAVAELAAILGQRLNDLAMYTLVDLPVARTMRAMTTLAAQRILRDAGNHLEFANEFVRGQCYVAMATPLRRMLHGLVADRLLQQDGGDEPIPGLEIAWHLVRANRLREAIPYLLAGGREAIRRGAPHEADLALTTGIPALSGAALRTAILLLAEARQELGRWEESLQVLELPAEPYTESEACEREVMQIVARRWLGVIPTADFDSAVERLCEIARSEYDIEVRVKALSATPYFLTQTRTPAAIERLGSSIRIVDQEPMDQFQRLHVLMARAWYEDQRRNTGMSMTLISEAVAIMDDIGAGSSIAIRILVGAGMLQVQRGKYREAVPLLERAVAMAKKIDNSLHIAAASAALSLAQGRLGLTSEQMRWANLSLASLPPDDWGIVALTAVFEKALALVSEERSPEAHCLMSENDARFTHRKPAWVRQAWLLMKADIYTLCGETRRANKAARAATSGDHATLHVNDFAGPHARWKALIAIADGGAQTELERQLAALSELEKFHAKDQVELIGSIALLEKAVGLNSGHRWTMVESRLRELPEHVGNTMRRLGLKKG